MSSNRIVYKPADVEVEIGGKTRHFKIHPDGSIYGVKRTVRPARNKIELYAALKKNAEPPYNVTKETVRKVKNPKLEKIVFHKYLSDLEERKRKEEQKSIKYDEETEQALLFPDLDTED